MHIASGPFLRSALPRRVLAGMAGTVVMSAFWEMVEMPLTGRGASYAPARFASTVTRGRAVIGVLKARSALPDRRNRNRAAHFASTACGVPHSPSCRPGAYPGGARSRRCSPSSTPATSC